MKLRTARPRAILPVLLTAVVIAAPAAISAQGLSAEVSAGRLVYDPLAANVGTNNLMGSLRYDTAREAWVYGAEVVASQVPRAGAPRSVLTSPGTAIPIATRSATRSALVVSLKPSPSSGFPLVWGSSRDAAVGEDTR